MSSSAVSGGLDGAAAEQAANWFARQRMGALSDAEGLEFAAWLGADASHAIAWRAYERVWGRVECVRDEPRILAMREVARALRKRGSSEWTLRWGGRRVASYVGVAVAMCGLVGVGTWWNLRSAVGERVAPTISEAESGASRVGESAVLVRDAVTEVGERSTLLLADGSRMILNTRSAVHADFTGRERAVTLLRGEAFFEVAKDASRPFVVLAGSRRVVAVGTSFDVRVQDDHVKVTLVEGKVRVAGAVLEAGSAWVGVDGGVDRVERVDAERTTSWRTGKLVFDGDRLADVIAEMNRYSRERLEIDDVSLGERRVSGVFEPAGGRVFAKALESYGIARVAQESESVIVLESPR